LVDNAPLIGAEVLALGLPTKRQRNAKLVSFVIRYYKQHLKPAHQKRGGIEPFDERRERRNAEWDPTTSPND
jgi:hypothetical protein